jgi:hypothetical protein
VGKSKVTSTFFELDEGCDFSGAQRAKMRNRNLFVEIEPQRGFLELVARHRPVWRSATEYRNARFCPARSDEIETGEFFEN